MKTQLLWLVLILLTSGLYAQQLQLAPTAADGLLYKQKSAYGFVDELRDLIDQSEFFGDRAGLLEFEYQVVSNRLKRDDFTKLNVPAVGVVYEKRIIHNLGVRLSLAAHWWVEDNVLARSTTRDYDQEINYLYNTISLGPTWHFAINDRIDPYVGLAYSYRHMLVTCICLREIRQSHDLDLIMGVRYLLAGQFYGKFEIGHTGTAYLKFGLGFRLGYK